MDRDLRKQQIEVSSLPDGVLYEEVSAPPGTSRVNGLLAAIELGNRADLRKRAQSEVSPADQRGMKKTVIQDLLDEARALLGHNSGPSEFGSIEMPRTHTPPMGEAEQAIPSMGPVHRRAPIQGPSYPYPQMDDRPKVYEFSSGGLVDIPYSPVEGQWFQKTEDEKNRELRLLAEQDRQRQASQAGFAAPTAGLSLFSDGAYPVQGYRDGAFPVDPLEAERERQRRLLMTPEGQEMLRLSQLANSEAAMTRDWQNRAGINRVDATTVEPVAAGGGIANAPQPQGGGRRLTQGISDFVYGIPDTIDSFQSYMSQDVGDPVSLGARAGSAIRDSLVGPEWNKRIDYGLSDPVTLGANASSYLKGRIEEGLGSIGLGSAPRPVPESSPNFVDDTNIPGEGPVQGPSYPYKGPKSKPKPKPKAPPKDDGSVASILSEIGLSEQDLPMEEPVDNRSKYRDNALYLANMAQGFASNPDFIGGFAQGTASATEGVEKLRAVREGREARERIAAENMRAQERMADARNEVSREAIGQRDSAAKAQVQAQYALNKLNAMADLTEAQATAFSRAFIDAYEALATDPVMGGFGMSEKEKNEKAWGAAMRSINLFRPQQGTDPYSAINVQRD